MNQYSDSDLLRLYGDKIDGDLLRSAFRIVDGLAQELVGEVIFPTCFETALRLRKELKDPNLSIAGIARAVSVEPLVATRLTRLASSAMYAIDGRPVRDLASAINRLGTNLVRATALSITMGQILQAKEMLAFSLFARKLWDHSVRSAAAARVLAYTYTRIDPEEAFLAGLVHDLGAFYMLYRLSQYPQLCAKPEAVTILVARSHESIGSSLLAALGVPEEVVRASMAHDCPRELPDAPRTLADVVHIANILTREHCEWLVLDFDEQAETVDALRDKYAGLKAEIDVAAQEMGSIFG